LPRATPKAPERLARQRPRLSATTVPKPDQAGPRETFHGKSHDRTDLSPCRGTDPDGGSRGRIATSASPARNDFTATLAVGRRLGRLWLTRHHWRAAAVGGQISPSRAT